MKITKELARTIAVMATEKQEKAVDKARENLASEVEKKYLESLPKEVIDLFNSPKSRDFFKTTTNIRLSGPGFCESDFVSVSKRVPATSDGYYQTVLKLKKREEADLILRCYNVYKETKEKHEELIEEIFIALVNLRTVKRAAAEMPEIAKFLPKDKDKNLPALNLSSLRNKISNQPI